MPSRFLIKQPLASANGHDMVAPGSCVSLRAAGVAGAGNRRQDKASAASMSSVGVVMGSAPGSGVATWDALEGEVLVAGRAVSNSGMLVDACRGGSSAKLELSCQACIAFGLSALPVLTG